MKKILIGIIVIVTTTAKAQDSIRDKNNPLSFSGYAEVYYGYDFNKPADNNRPSFVYSYNRHNEFNVNLSLLRATYTTDKIRGNIALAAGTYVNANYATEPGVLKNLYEGNIGIKISKKKNLWIDAGVFASHIGFESAVGKDCWNLTRCIVGDNTPYFESGAKITYTSKNHKWLLSALALNGWQRIQRVSGNSLMSWGTQVGFTPSGKVTINWSAFFGTDKPDSARLWRVYHNFYGIFQFNDKIGLTLGFDIGREQVSKGSSNKNTVYSPVAIVRFTPNDKWAIALRGEYYSDKNGIIISTGTPNGFKTFGVSVNVDRNITGNVVWRAEFRTLNSKDAFFVKGNNVTNIDDIVTTSLALKF
ncbi:MAG TPA: porin [Chitinophagaceae bacterium]|nr:porin [Chitinophagaceae bacterium]